MGELQGFRGLNERLVIDTSEKDPVYLLIGKNGSHIRLSASAHQLLRSISSGISFEAMAEILSRQQDRSISPTEVETAYKYVVGQIAEIERTTNRNPPGFWLRIRCLPEALVTQIARHLSVAFHPMMGFSLLMGVVVITALMLRYSPSPTFNTAAFWSGYGLFLLSVIAHELGHASACARYGARPSGIGFAIYLIYPVFYSDVSAAWQLKRWQRVMVDLGGAFFQLVLGASYAVAFMFSGWEPLKVAFVIILYSCLFALNPVFKFDGYWVVADSLGVTNLGQQPRRILRYFLDRLRGRPTKLLPWRTSIIGILVLYTLLSLGMWGYFIWIIVPIMWLHISNYPAVVASLISAVFNRPHTLLGVVQPFLVSTFGVFILLLMLLRIVRLLLVPGHSLVLRLLRVMKDRRRSLAES